MGSGAGVYGALLAGRLGSWAWEVPGECWGWVKGPGGDLACGRCPTRGRGLVLPSVLCLHLLQVQQQRPHLPWPQWRSPRRPGGTFRREACPEAGTRGGRPGGDGGRGPPSARKGRGPAALSLRGPRLGWLQSWHQILPGPGEAPRPVPFRLGCSVAALVFTPIPQHLYSLMG